MICPKCYRLMEKDNRASDKKREVWSCLRFDCKHFLTVPLPDKDEQIAHLQADLKLCRMQLKLLKDFYPGQLEKVQAIAEQILANAGKENG